MKISFPVGHQEKHHVDFSWSKWLGVARIWVDGRLKLKTKPLALDEMVQASRLNSVSGQIKCLSQLPGTSSRLSRSWILEVGDEEKHVIQIVKTRPKILAAFLPHDYQVYVDNVLVKRTTG